ncbi:MAG: hypothetical protein EOO90_00085 [Pedobacter sp.]|nr:MAG: hypothetical protein EOO90_00085 [Pedobacter sp.]
MSRLRPLVKWTGGKFDEFPYFASHVPKFERYVEPFFGGGGVFFALQPDLPSLINDKSEDLIDFYKQILTPEFEKELYRYADAWEALGELTTFLWRDAKTSYTKFTKGTESVLDLKESLKKKLYFFVQNNEVLGDENFIVDLDAFQITLLTNILSKAKRIKNILEKENKSFKASELLDHFETGIRSGAYLFFRKLLNQHYHKVRVLDNAKAAANWYFIREFCYGAMFRFNKKGDFNIPYGGIAYNTRKFRKKISKIFAPRVKKLFSKASLFNHDFEKFLTESDLQKGDFVFVDPPYDSEFSEYDQSAFTQHDQKRLSDFLKNTPAKWMLVIKETEFIRELYTDPKIRIADFGKNYIYNVRGRNGRKVTHLIIMNY